MSGWLMSLGANVVGANVAVANVVGGLCRVTLFERGDLEK